MVSHTSHHNSATNALPHSSATANAGTGAVSAVGTGKDAPLSPDDPLATQKSPALKRWRGALQRLRRKKRGGSGDGEIEGSSSHGAKSMSRSWTARRRGSAGGKDKKDLEREDELRRAYSTSPSALGSHTGIGGLLLDYHSSDDDHHTSDDGEEGDEEDDEGVDDEDELLEVLTHSPQQISPYLSYGNANYNPSSPEGLYDQQYGDYFGTRTEGVRDGIIPRAVSAANIPTISASSAETSHNYPMFPSSSLSTSSSMTAGNNFSHPNATAMIVNRNRRRSVSLGAVEGSDSVLELARASAAADEKALVRFMLEKK